MIVNNNQLESAIAGLNIDEISYKMLKYLTQYFNDAEIALDDGVLFSESYLLEFDEIKSLLSDKHCSKLDNKVQFNGASGFLRFKNPTAETKDKEYTVMLLSSEDYNQALLLFLRIEDLKSDKVDIILIKDFTI